MNPAAPLACRQSRLTGTAIFVIVLCAIPLVSRADTVASLLGNFTINQYCGLQITDKSVRVRYTVIFGQLPALRELHEADANADGVTTQAERDAYVQRLAPEFASQLKVTVDGAALPLHVTHWTSSLPTEQGGFSLRLDTDFEGALPTAAATGVRTLRFSNQNYSGRIGWHEIAVQPAGSTKIFDTNAYSTSLTGGLTEALRTLPAGGPLDERSVRLSFTHGDMPSGAQLLQPRPQALPARTAPRAVGTAETAWLQEQTRRLVGLISASKIEPRVALLALLTALVLGAMHAFSPGHGKTIVGAYLIGSRGTPKHAAFLGLTVTVTHTLGVFALGFATLFASRFIVPERLFPVLSLFSGLIVMAMGMVLLAQRWRAARDALGRTSQPPSNRAHARLPLFAVAGGPADPHDHGHHHHEHGHSGHGEYHAHGHQHDHDGHVHTHDHHSHVDPAMHSHGGSLHSHVPSGGADISWRSLLALGISGGLIPCPSAMVLLLAAVALNKTAYGMLLVLSFSIGLAVTLTAVGIAFLYARNSFGPPSESARWPHLLPIASAGVITLVGAALCFGALQAAHL